jgi:hypothetical protein
MIDPPRASLFFLFFFSLSLFYPLLSRRSGVSFLTLHQDGGGGGGSIYTRLDHHHPPL